MKNILKISLSVVVSMMLMSSCGDFLDENPEYNRTTENSYKDAESLKSGLIGAYDQLKHTIRHNCYFLGILGTDEAMGQTNTIYNNLSRYVLPANDPHYLPVWYECHFRMIAQCNTLIKCGLAIEQTEEVKYIINECRLLRALAYFRLAQVFGPVPLMDQPVEGTVNYGMPRAAMKDIYKLIISDLVAASADGALPLPNEVDAKEIQRPNVYVAKALLGRVYVTLASTIEAGVVDRVLASIDKADLGYANYEETPKELYAKAEQVLGEIISSGYYTLNKNYGDLFTIENNNKIPENMWQIQFNTTLDYGQYFHMVMGMWTNNGDLNVRCNTIGLGLCQVTYPKTMYFSYSNDDVRRDWNLCCRVYLWDLSTYKDGDPSKGDVDREIATIYNGITKFRVNSHQEMHEPSNYTDIWNKPVLQTIVRYADVLLLYAEASMQANGGVATQAGVDAINEVRQRARGYHEDGSPISVSEKPTVPNFAVGNLDMDKILEERKLELCYEGHRWFDLVRCGRLIEKYNEPVYPQSEPMFQQVRMTENQYLYQIPQTQIDGTTNPKGFFQNPM